MLQVNLGKTGLTCTKCYKIKGFSEYYYRKEKKKYRSECKSCIAIARKIYETNNKEKISKYKKEYILNNKEMYERKKIYFKEMHLKRRYNITTEEKGKIKVAQDNKCAICKEVFIKSPNVDHCHITNKIRGLLCHRCNIMLGHSKDNIEILQNAIIYLKDRN